MPAVSGESEEGEGLQSDTNVSHVSDKKISGRNNDFGMAPFWGDDWEDLGPSTYILTFQIVDVEQEIHIMEKIIVKHDNLILRHIITNQLREGATSSFKVLAFVVV